MMFASSQIYNQSLVSLSGASAITDEGTRLDIAASGFWGGHHERAFFDVWIFNPHVSSNCQPISTCYRKHENTKRRAYEPCVREIEHGSFTPLVLSATGGLENAAALYDCNKAWSTLQQHHVLVELYPFLRPPSLFHSMHQGIPLCSRARHEATAAPYWPVQIWGMSWDLSHPRIQTKRYWNSHWLDVLFSFFDTPIFSLYLYICYCHWCCAHLIRFYRL